MKKENIACFIDAVTGPTTNVSQPRVVDPWLVVFLRFASLFPSTAHSSALPREDCSGDSTDAVAVAGGVERTSGDASRGDAGGGDARVVGSGDDAAIAPADWKVLWLLFMRTVAMEPCGWGVVGQSFVGRIETIGAGGDIAIPFGEKPVMKFCIAA